MLQARYIQAAIWLSMVAAVYVAVLVYEQSAELALETRFFTLVGAILSVGLIDLLYLLLGLAVVARRRGQVRGEQRRYLVTGGYLPLWLVTMVVFAFLACVYLFTTHPWFDPPFASNSVFFALLSPLLLRSHQWGLAHFTPGGISVVWDDGGDLKLRWMDCPTMMHLEGKLTAAHVLPSFSAGDRDFRLVGRDRQAGIEAARSLWSAARTNDAPNEEREP